MSEDQVHASIAVLNELEKSAKYYAEAFKKEGEKGINFKFSYLLILSFLNVIPNMQIPADLEENTVARLRGIAGLLSQVKHSFSEKLITKIRIMLQRFPAARNIPKKDIKEV